MYVCTYVLACVDVEIINFLFLLSWDDLENNLSLKDAVVSS